MTQCINAGIKILSEDTFSFDGVTYRNKNLSSKLHKIRNLLTTSKVLTGKPRQNDLYWAFLLSDGRVELSKDKNKYSSGVIFVKRGKLFDLIHQYHSGELYWEANEKSIPT